MPPEASTSAGDRASAALVANLLDQGRVIHLLAVALCAGATVALLLMPGWRTGLVSAAVLLLGLGETWMALRVGFDAGCFRSIAEGADGLDLEGFDGALGQLGLLPPGKAGRPIGRRAAGAKRLLLLQGALLFAQIGLLLLALAVTSHG